MSTVFSNRIAVPGAAAKVREFRKDARRILPAKLKAEIKLSSIAFSFEHLLRLHPKLSYPDNEIPRDEYHYLSEAEPLTKWNEFAQAQYTLEVSNTQIHQILLPLSRYYPELAFVNSELCLDDGTVLSVYTRRQRQFQWDLPEERSEAYWKAAADKCKMDLDSAYDDDEVRWEVEDKMLSEGLAHWDDRILRTLRRSQK
jgi:hypothetical protein